MTDYVELLNELADFGIPEDVGERREIAMWAARKVAEERVACVGVVREVWQRMKESHESEPDPVVRNLTACTLNALSALADNILNRGQ